jgi:hypothetical protein
MCKNHEKVTGLKMIAAEWELVYTGRGSAVNRALDGSSYPG